MAKNVPSLESKSPGGWEGLIDREKVDPGRVRSSRALPKFSRTGGPGVNFAGDAFRFIIYSWHHGSFYCQGKMQGKCA